MLRHGLPYETTRTETALRMQRYLRQPLSVLAGLVGKHGQDEKRTVIDQHGDGVLSGYKAETASTSRCTTRFAATSALVAPRPT
jgi:hypothetical protein